MLLSRREWLAAAVGGVQLASARGVAQEPESRTLRVIAYNIFGLTGWPKQRPRALQAVASGRIAKLLADELALHEPHIVNFSESPGEELTKEIAGYLNMQHVRFPSGEKWPGTLLSKYDIVDSSNAPTVGPRPKGLFTRHWGRATIKLPGEDALIVHSAHLFPTADPAIRLQEIHAMVASMKQDIDAGRSMLLMGDLNHGPDSAEYQHWIDAGWKDTFAEVGRGAGNTIRSDIPKWRIDYVMAAGPIAGRMMESRPLFQGAFRLNIANTQTFALSDHLPQLAVFRLS